MCGATCARKPYEGAWAEMTENEVVNWCSEKDLFQEASRPRACEWLPHRYSKNVSWWWAPRRWMSNVQRTRPAFVCCQTKTESICEISTLTITKNKLVD